MKRKQAIKFLNVPLVKIEKTPFQKPMLECFYKTKIKEKKMSLERITKAELIKILNKLLKANAHRIAIEEQYKKSIREEKNNNF